MGLNDLAHGPQKYTDAANVELIDELARTKAARLLRSNEARGSMPQTYIASGKCAKKHLRQHIVENMQRNKCPRWSKLNALSTLGYQNHPGLCDGNTFSIDSIQQYNLPDE